MIIKEVGVPRNRQEFNYVNTSDIVFLTVNKSRFAQYTPANKETKQTFVGRNEL